MFRIRVHGRGGQGIKSAGRVLGTAFFRAGFEVQDAPLYGAERRGAPMFAYVRAGHEPIRERGLVTNPGLVVVADETLVGVAAANVLLGVNQSTVMLICGTTDATTWQTRLGFGGRVVTLPVVAQEQAHAQWLVGASCAGAASRLSGVITRETLLSALQDELSGFGPDTLSRTLEHAVAAFDAMEQYAGIVQQGAVSDASSYVAPDWIELPVDPASVSAPDIFSAATSVQARTGLWRTMRPQIDYDRCNRCTWVCSTFCPDSAIAVREDGAPEIDLDHCKGCLVCVSVCPPHAIGALPERDFVADEKVGAAG